MTGWAYAAILGYILGATPFGLIITRLAGQGDVRKIGSGSIGTTNVLRTGRKDLAALTLLADVGKGAVAVYLAKYIWAGEMAQTAGTIAGAAAFIGHLFPSWLRFKGGKGVATYIGVLAGLVWPAALTFCAVWLFTAYIRKQSSTAGITAAVTAPIFVYNFSSDMTLTIVFAVLSALLVWKHASNIKRLLAGTEPKIGETK